VNKNPLVLSFFFHEPFPKRTTLLLVPLFLKIPFLPQQLKNSAGIQWKMWKIIEEKRGLNQRKYSKGACRNIG
jgi:hypothetical protein